MASSGHEREQELFLACLELPVTDRGAYLDRTCGGDAHLRARVERLLAADDRARVSTLSPLPPEPEAAELPDLLGPYRLCGVLGEGGMAVVYEAEQVEPIRRTVALKVVKLGMDTRQVVARFKGEQQALAALDHPYVAKVFDAGQTEAGRPYFVMERVRGVPLREYERLHPLSTADKVALTIRICQAVQHAHQKGVIHRDLKPSNILVAPGDGGLGALPKIIDFGIAKAVGLAGFGATETRVDQMLGTPAYMSPEQAGRGGLDVDTRTDVYSLGVILYELLTGTLPLDPTEVGYTEFLSRLSRGELHPPRPSERARRRELAGDLDWIVMKALEVDRARRYETPQALADDLARYTRHEAVTARPPSRLYRVRKFVARHTLSVSAAAAIVAAIVGGAGVAVWQARAAIAEKERAEEVKEFIASIFRDADPAEGADRVLSATDLLKQAKERIDRSFADRPELRVELLSLLGASLAALDDHEAADGVLAQAVQDGSRALGADHPRTLHARVLYTNAHRFLGRQAQMRQDLDALLPLLRGQPAASREDLVLALENQAHLAIDDGRPADAVAAAREASEMAAAVLGPRHRTTVALGRLLALAYHFEKKNDLALATAEPAYRLTLDVYRDRPKHPDIIDAHALYGRMLAEVGRLDEAIEHMGRAVDDARALFGPSSTMVGFFSGRLSQYLQTVGEVRLSLQKAEENFAILGKLAAPDSFTHLSARQRYAHALLAARQGDRALSELTLTADGYRRTRGSESDWVWSTEVARALALGYVGRVPEARREIDRLIALRRDPPGAGLDRALHVRGVLERLGGDARAALASQERALQAIPPGPKAARERLPVLVEIGLDHVELDRHDRAVAVLSEALAQFESLQRRTSPPQADALVALGRAQLARGRTAEALAAFEEADRFWTEFDADSPWAGEAAGWLGRGYEAAGRAADARSAGARARRIRGAGV